MICSYREHSCTKLAALNAGREVDLVGIIVEFHLIVSCIKKVELIVVLQLGMLLSWSQLQRFVTRLISSSQALNKFINSYVPLCGPNYSTS